MSQPSRSARLFFPWNLFSVFAVALIFAPTQARALHPCGELYKIENGQEEAVLIDDPAAMGYTFASCTGGPEHDEFPELEDEPCNKCIKAAGNPISMLDGSKMLDEVDVAISSADGVPLSITRSYKGAMRSRLGSTYSDYVGGIQSESLGLPWVTQRDERLDFNAKVPSFYNNYEFPVQIRLSDASGNFSYYYPFSEVEDSEISSIGLTHKIGNRFRHRSVKEYRVSEYMGLDGGGNCVCNVFTIWKVSNSDLEFSTEQSALNFLLGSAPNYVDYKSRNPRISSEKIRLSGFEYQFSFTENNSVTGNCCTSSIDLVSEDVYELAWNESLASDIEWIADDGLTKRFYDKTSPRLLKSVDLVQQGLTIEHFPGATFSANGETYDIAQRIGDGTTWEERQILYRDEVNGGVTSRFWAVRYEDSVSSDQVREVAVWHSQNGQLFRVDYPDAKVSIGYTYGSYNDLGGGLLFQGAGDPPDNLPNGAGYTLVTDEAPLCEILIGPLGGTLQPVVRYQNWAAFDMTNDSGVPGRTPRHYGGVARKTWVPYYASATQQGPAWKLLYKYEFEGKALAADPHRTMSGSSSYGYGYMEVNKFWQAGMADNEESWIEYVKDRQTGSIHEINYPDAEVTPLDYLGDIPLYGGLSVRNVGVLDTLFARVFEDELSETVHAHERLSQYGLTEELPLKPFDGLAESAISQPFLDAGPDSTWDVDSFTKTYKLGRLTETASYGGMERVQRVTDRYGNKTEYIRETTGTYAGDLIGTEFYPAQLSGGQITYPSTPPVSSSSTFEVHAGWRRPLTLVSEVGSRTYTTTITYDTTFVTKPKIVSRYFGDVSTGHLDASIEYTYDIHGRPVEVEDLISGATTEIQFLRDSPFSSIPKAVIKKDPANRTDVLLYTYYDETSGPTYSFFSPLLERVELNSNERQINYDSYDELGRVLEISDDYGRGVEYHRSPDGRVHQVDTTRTGETPRSIEYTYDPDGHDRVIEVTDQNGKVSKRHYDPFGRLAATENPLGEVLVRLYDPAVRAEDDNSENEPTVDVLGYSSCGCSAQTSGWRVYRTIRFEPLDSGESWNETATATLNEHAIEIWDYYFDSGGSVGYAAMYESMEQAEEVDPVASRELFALRDHLGQLKYMIDSGFEIGNLTFEYEHNDFSHDNPFALTAEIAPDGFKRTYEYDERGRLEATVNELGIRSSIERDATYHWTDAAESPLAGRTELFRGDGTTTPWGFMEKVVRGNGTSTHYEYDSLERQSAIAHKFGATGANFMRASYLRDAATWNRTKETVDYASSGGSNALVFDYAYDAFDALDSYDLTPQGSTTTVSAASRSYTVDPGHNITNIDGFNSFHNDFNQLYKKVVGTTQGHFDLFEYDNRGNLSTWERSPVDPGGPTEYAFEYDELNHLKSATYHIPFGGYETVSYKVDATGRLAHRDSTLEGTDGRRFFSSGLEPSVTLLDREPKREYYEEFSATGAFNAWDEPTIPEHDSNWSWVSGEKVRATVDNQDQGVLLWPSSFEQGEEHQPIDFTVQAEMDLSSLITISHAGQLSAKAGVVFDYREQGSARDYYRVMAWWEGPSLGTSELKLELEKFSSVTNKFGVTTVTLESLGIDSYSMVDAPEKITLRVRVYQENPAESSDIEVEADVFAAVTAQGHAIWSNNALTATIEDESLDPEGRPGLYAGNGEDYVWFYGAGFEREWANPTPKWHNAPQTASWSSLSGATVTQGSDPNGPVSGWVTASSGSTSAGVWWDGNSPSTLGHHANPEREVMGLLLRREANSSGAMQIRFYVDTSKGYRWLVYSTAATAYSATSTTITIPLKGDLDEAGAGSGWQLVALDPRRDLRLATWNASADPTHATLGRIRQIRVQGNHFSVGGLWAWERMPERLYTGAAGEWTLARWSYDETVANSTPYYEIRHRHLHRNARLDVTGFSPLDPASQDTEARQYSPYGRLLAKGAGDQTSGVVVLAASFPAAGGTWARSDMMGLGLAGKPYDPEVGLYYFGHRWYSPELRRWTQAEPLGLDGPNLYHFNFNDPVNKIDLNGLSSERMDIQEILDRYRDTITKYEETCDSTISKKNIRVMRQVLASAEALNREKGGIQILPSSTKHGGMMRCSASYEEDDPRFWSDVGLTIDTINSINGDFNEVLWEELGHYHGVNDEHPGPIIPHYRGVPETDPRLNGYSEEDLPVESQGKKLGDDYNEMIRIINKQKAKTDPDFAKLLHEREIQIQRENFSKIYE